jgi:trehalose 6-phosphate phosphatase
MTRHDAITASAGPYAWIERSLPPARTAYLLDVDGTIVDIAPTPEAVRVPTSLKRTLDVLRERTHGAVALVSGREIASVDRLFSPAVHSSIGCHGAEIRVDPNGPVLARSSALPNGLRNRLVERVADLPSIRVEDKIYTMAFHYRRAPACKDELERRLNQCLAAYAGEFNLLAGKCVFEVKPRGVDKGVAVRELMRSPPFANRRPVYCGDDTTDEPAFEAIRELGGVGIAVGRKMGKAELVAPSAGALRLWLAACAGSDRPVRD